MNNCATCDHDECQECPNCVKIHEKLINQLNIGKIDVKTKFGQHLVKEQNKIEKQKGIAKALDQKNTNHTLKHILEYIILDKSIDVKRLLDVDSSSSVAGNLYQALWLIMILLDRLHGLTSKDYRCLEIGKIGNDIQCSEFP